MLPRIHMSYSWCVCVCVCVCVCNMCEITIFQCNVNFNLSKSTHFKIAAIIHCNVSKSTHFYIAEMFHANVSQGGHFNVSESLQESCRDISQLPCNIAIFQWNIYEMFLLSFGAVWDVKQVLNNQGPFVVSVYIRLIFVRDRF